MFNRSFKVCTILLLLSRTLVAQVGETYFSAGPANIADWRTALVNPSIGAFQSGALEVGFKIHHWGFADEGGAVFKSSFALINLPRSLPEKLTLGGQMQLFSTPLFQHTHFRVSLSRQVSRSVSVGVSVGMQVLSYDESEFDLVDPGDPVFSNGTSLWEPDLGIGVSAIFFSQLVVGVAVNHLNQPSMALGNGNADLKPAISIGFALNLEGFSVQPSVEIGQNAVAARGIAQISDTDLGSIQFGYGEQALLLRSSLRVSGPFSVGYGFSYPMGELAGTSAGTHEGSLLFEFDRLRSVPETLSPPEPWEAYIPEMPRVDITPQFYTLANQERVAIVHKKLVRRFDPSLDSAQVSRLSLFDVGILDSAQMDTPFPYRLMPVTDQEFLEGDSSGLSANYLRALDSMKTVYRKDQSKVRLVSPADQDERALMIGQYLAGTDSMNQNGMPIYRAIMDSTDSLRLTTDMVAMLPEVSELYMVSPTDIVFSVFPVPENNAMPWRLVVEDEAGIPVFLFNSIGDSQTDIVWDARGLDGRIVDAGFYGYYVAWNDEYGEERRSPAHELYIRKLTRTLHVTITRDFQPLGESPSAISIILNK